MTLEQLTDFFLWMMIVNIGLLTLSSVLVMALKGTLIRWHGNLFGLTENQVAVAAYGYLGVFKVLVIVFNIVPYVALRILGG